LLSKLILQTLQMSKPKKIEGLRRVSFYITDQLYNKILLLQESRGDTTESETIKESIRVHYDKKFPGYLEGKRPESSFAEEDTPATKKAKLKTKLKEKELKNKAKKEMMLDTQMSLCEDLGGTVEKGKCIYYTYDERLRFKQETPVNLLTQEIVDRQYFPSKERVEELQKKKKTTY